MSEENTNLKEQHDKYLDEMKWPPVIPLEEGGEVQLSDMDVDWMFCTVLNMKWRDAKEVTDLKERKFLYNKALLMADSLRKEHIEVENKKAEVEKQIQQQVNQMQSQLGGTPAPPQVNL